MLCCRWGRFCFPAHGSTRFEVDPTLAKVHIWISTPEDGGWFDGVVLRRLTPLEPDGI